MSDDLEEEKDPVNQIQENNFSVKSNSSKDFIPESDEDLVKTYINANNINGFIHNFSENSFIATQGPLPNYVYRFW